MLELFRTRAREHAPLFSRGSLRGSLGWAPVAGSGFGNNDDGLIAWSEGKTEEAERGLRTCYLFFQQQHDTANATPAASDLAQVLCDLGRYDEAGALAEEIAQRRGSHESGATGGVADGQSERARQPRRA